MTQATARLVVNRYLREMERGLDRVLEHQFLSAPKWNERDAASFATSLSSLVEFARDRHAFARCIAELIKGTEPEACRFIFQCFLHETHNPVQCLACMAFQVSDASRMESQSAELEKLRADFVNSLLDVRRSIGHAVKGA